MCSKEQLCAIPTGLCDAIADAVRGSVIARNDAPQSDVGTPTQTAMPHVCEEL